MRYCIFTPLKIHQRVAQAICCSYNCIAQQIFKGAEKSSRKAGPLIVLGEPKSG